MGFGFTRRFSKLVIAAILVPSLAGCSRTKHRLNADREAYCTIDERNTDPRWSESNLGIDMDPRSRYYDPYNPDCSPMPMDDPAAHRYMRCVDGKKGWKHWNDNGVRSDLENPQWRVRLAEYVELTDENAIELDVDSAVRLAYVNAPLHQRALETLYLTSLDVTGERFRLDTQFFGGYDTRYVHQGSLSPARIGYSNTLGRFLLLPPIDGVESNLLSVGRPAAANPAFSVRRRFATAGEVLVGFANSFVFEFTGADVNLASSLANFSFIQPLLRGAGRDVALEQLTLSERRLLGNLRAYSQFRQGFFTQIVIGELGVNGPQRSGLGTNLQSFSGFGRVDGFLGLLQRAQQIRNTEDNLRLQLRTLDRLEALYENELIDIVQVDQFRQNIEVTRANLLDQINGLELAVDNYKTQILGLPPDLPINLDEQLVQQFQLIPSGSAPLLKSLLDLQQRIGDIGELLDLTERVDFLDLQLPELPDQDLAGADLTLRRLTGLVDSAGRRLENLPADLSQLENRDQSFDEDLSDSDREALSRIAVLVGDDAKKLSQRFRDDSQRLGELLDDLTEDNLAVSVAANFDWLTDVLSMSRAVVVIQSAAGDLASEPERVFRDAQQFVEPAQELFAQARGDLDRLEEAAVNRERSMDEEGKTRFRRDREKLNERLEDLQLGDSGLEVSLDVLNRLQDSYTIENRRQTVKDLTGWIQSYLQLAERLALVPAQARLESIAVEEVDLEPEAAFQIALENRLDFMNGRAALVDRWRAIQVAADALQSDLSLTGGGNIRTATNNPVDFRAATSTLRLGIEFDAPLARLLERNGYREALITFQRNRRNLIQSEDALYKGLRALLRTLEQRKLQLEIQRRAVTIALRRVDQTQLSLLTPPPQGQPGARPQINPTTAINLLGAQSSLQTSQNSFLAAWLDYYAARLRLYRELGVMQLDPSGRWIENSVDFGGGDSNLINESDSIESLPPPLPSEALEVKLEEQDGSDESGQEFTLTRPVNVSRRGDVGTPTTDKAGNSPVQFAE